MNQSSKRNLPGLHQIQQENKIQPDRREREREREREKKEKGEGRPFHPCTNLTACKATSVHFLHQIKTKTKKIKNKKIKNSYSNTYQHFKYLKQNH